MIAHLGMYDRPDANAALWSAIRSELGYGPESLTKSDDYWAIWQSPDLLFAQTCGYPFRARLHPDVRLIGTPDYGLPGCPPGHYRSVFLRRRDNPRTDLSEFHGARFAYNEALSQSGWAAPISHLLTQELRPGALVETGAHVRSARAVQAGDADFAALDALTWLLATETEPELAQDLEVVAETTPTPALPYITGPKTDPDALFAAIQTAIATLPAQTRDALHLRGLIHIPAETYLAVPTPPAPDALDVTSL